ncbi:MAG: FAD/NAD(P)-binding protein [Candidatus Bathyarchaeota archaeon]|nr:MAG: FAD/NAD(P)-binding protein [Candidatus Bathyarchaeota archaeon]
MNNPYIPNLVVIRKITTENEARDIKTFELVFKDPKAMRSFGYRCGQFAEISVFGAGECPIGIASSPMEEDSIQFTVKRVGVVTTALHNSVEGTVIGVRGPYGNGFPMEKMEGRNVVIVGGGFAFTTLRSLTNFILHEANRDRFKEITVIYGARDPGELIYKYDIEAWGKRKDINLNVTIDRAVTGWSGLVGFVPAVLKEVAPSSENAIAIVCGPPIMIKFTMPVIDELGFSPEEVYLSLEMRMKCGIGKCGRCNIGNKFVCKDGPVFTFEELKMMPREY